VSTTPGFAGKAIAYSLNCWDALVRVFDGGHLCLSNKRCRARPARHHRRSPHLYLIETTKLDDTDPLA
jgi:hypothetical protein